MTLQPTDRATKIQARKLRSAIRKVHPSITAFAKSLGRSRKLVERILVGRGTSAYVAGAISGLCGKAPWELWPERYAPPTVAVPSEPPQATTTAPAA